MEVVKVKYELVGHLDGESWNWLVDNFGMDDDGCIVIDRELLKEIKKKGNRLLHEFLYRVFRRHGEEVAIRAL